MRVPLPRGKLCDAAVLASGEGVKLSPAGDGSAEGAEGGPGVCEVAASVC